MDNFYQNIAEDALKNIQRLVANGFQQVIFLSIKFDNISKENEYLRTRIKELEELLKIAKERD